MEILFRVDSSHKIGGGHLTRCINLANFFKKKSIDSFFICQDLEGLDVDLLENSDHKFKVIEYTKDFEIDALNTIETIKNYDLSPWALFVDHYEIDYKWETKLKKYSKKIVIIDDLANKKHDCNFLINQIYKTKKSSYNNLVPNKCNLLLGSKYLILKSGFLEAREKVKEKVFNAEISDIHIFFSSSDELGLTIKYCKLLLNNFKRINLHVSVGNQFKFIDNLESLKKETKRISWVQNNPNIENQLAKCQIAIGTPGMTTWERACLGIPSIQIGITDYHEEIMKRLSSFGICNWVGHVDNLKDERFISICNNFFKDKKALKKMSKICMKKFDGDGMQRIYSKLIEES